MHICIYAYMHVCMYACMHICIYAYMHICICAYMHICIYACMHICIYMHVCIYTYIYTREPSCILHEGGTLHALFNHQRTTVVRFMPIDAGTLGDIQWDGAIQHQKLWQFPCNLRSNSVSRAACHRMVASNAAHSAARGRRVRGESWARDARIEVRAAKDKGSYW